MAVCYLHGADVWVRIRGLKLCIGDRGIKSLETKREV